MRVLRSILCAGLAIVAMGLCAVAVPIDASFTGQIVVKEIHPAPALHYVLREVAVLAAIVDAPAGTGQLRSSTASAQQLFANTSIASPAYQYIDPDIAA